MKQSGVAINRNPTKVASILDAHNDNMRRINYNTMYSNEKSKHVGRRRRATMYGGRYQTSNYFPHNHKVNQCVIG